MIVERSKREIKNQTVRNILIPIGLVIALAVVPLLLVNNAEFRGTDDQAQAAISEINPDYQPWFSAVWEPPSTEIESLLFAIQAALGAGIIGYYLGYVRGKSKREKDKYD